MQKRGINNMSSYRERALARVNENNDNLLEDLASGKYSIKSKYDNLSTNELIKEIESKDAEIHTLQSNVAVLNSKLYAQKQINIGLGVAYFLLILCISIKMFLVKYAKRIRNKTIEELKIQNKENI
jgi:hypothetical protein